MSNWVEIAAMISEIAPLTGFVSIIIAIVALRNARLAEKSIKQSYWYGEISESVRQSERYIEKFLPAYREIDSELTNMGYPERSWPSFQDIQNRLLKNEDKVLQEIDDLLIKDSKFRGKLFDVMNQLELVAMSFVIPPPQKHKALLSAREIAFQPMALSFCECCDRLGIFTLYVRKNKYPGLYSNIVRLYNDWKPKVKNNI